jgi:hypothetical protein
MWTCSCRNQSQEDLLSLGLVASCSRWPHQRRETRNIGEVIRVEGDQGRPVHQSLGCDHPVEQLPPRVASAGDNGPIGLRRKIRSRRRRLFAGRGSTPCGVGTAPWMAATFCVTMGVANAGGILQMIASLSTLRGLRLMQPLKKGCRRHLLVSRHARGHRRSAC